MTSNKDCFLRLLPTLSLGLAAIILATRTPQCLAFSTPTPAQREMVVRTYFDGVNKKDREQIKSCFSEEASIRDVCALNSNERAVASDILADRCMEFLAAHPDCVVSFHYGPKCSHDDNWVIAHWYETGTWSGDSKGIKATGNPMAVEGQTRFLVNDDLKITHFVVTRTFTEWEETLQKIQG